MIQDVKLVSIRGNDYKNEGLINGLVDEYKLTGSEDLKMAILKSFDGYFIKYATLLGTTSTVDLSSKDTVKFLRLFMTPEDRATDQTVVQAARRVVSYLRSLFKDITQDDMYNEVVSYFLEQLERYKPMIANHKHDKPRISFTHFVQVNIRYMLVKLIKLRSRDALQSSLDIPLLDNLTPTCLSDAGVNWSTIDLRWVHNLTTGDVFRRLSDMERYLLYLKYDEENKSPLSDYELARITGLDRMYIRRKLDSIYKKLEKLISAP